MALPTLSKTWQYNVNQALTATGTVLGTLRGVMRALVNSLLGFASNPWTCRGSSNGVTAAMDLTNRWAADSDLVWASGTRSWIVLRQTGIGSTFEICIDLNSSNAYFVSAFYSFVGFTGGSTSARPTASDETAIISIGQWTVSTDTAHKLHVMQSSDGKSIRMFCCVSSTVLSSFLSIDVPDNPSMSWTNPLVASWKGAGSGFAVTLASHNAASAAVAKHSATLMTVYFTAESFGGTVLPGSTGIGNTVNEISNEWELYPIGLGSSTVTRRGRIGSLPDIYWKPEGVGHGDTFPNDASRTFVAFGGVVVPWNGSVPALV